ncbi:MAG: hypothetical protein KatS3mg064_1237 [Tepidiforma sp.]|nr:hypothetical protein [Tepidiforma sp.]GIW18080.1 MAG: hypothetical protein KatS3mg064_1237 [Tepidiforma sp.]
MPRRRWRALLAAGLAAGALALAACGGGDDDGPTPTPASGETPAETPAATATPAAASPTPAGSPTPVVFEPTFTCANPIAPLEARLHRGEAVELQGRVFGTADRNGDAVLAVGASLDALLRVEVIIPAASRASFPGDPAIGFAARDVCVRGTVEDRSGILTITATSPDDITVVE